VNDRYLDDLVATLSTQYPEDYERTSKANFYKTNGTIATVSTTTNILTSADITFYNSMVGDRVYNDDQDDYQTIETYTDTGTVVLDDIPSTWAATDPIYVLGHEFALGGNATDVRT